MTYYDKNRDHYGYNERNDNCSLLSGRLERDLDAVRTPVSFRESRRPKKFGLSGRFSIEDNHTSHSYKSERFNKVLSDQVKNMRSRPNKRSPPESNHESRKYSHRTHISERYSKVRSSHLDNMRSRPGKRSPPDKNNESRNYIQRTNTSERFSKLRSPQLENMKSRPGRRSPLDKNHESRTFSQRRDKWGDDDEFHFGSSHSTSYRRGRNADRLKLSTSLELASYKSPTRIIPGKAITKGSNVSGVYMPPQKTDDFTEGIMKSNRSRLQQDKYDGKERLRILNKWERPRKESSASPKARQSNHSRIMKHKLMSYDKQRENEVKRPGTADQPMDLVSDSSDSDECEGKGKEDTQGEKSNFESASGTVHLKIQDLWIGCLKCNVDTVSFTDSELYFIEGKKISIHYSSFTEFCLYPRDIKNKDSMFIGPFIAIKVLNREFEEKYESSYDPHSSDTKNHYVVLRLQEDENLASLLESITRKLSESGTSHSIITEGQCEKYLNAIKLNNHEMPEKKSNMRLISMDVDEHDNEVEFSVLLTYPLPPCSSDLITITTKDVQRLRPGEYFNDNLIDYYFKWLLYEKFRDNSDIPNRVLCLSSHFYSHLTDGSGMTTHARKYDGYKKVASWTNIQTLFYREVIIVPINRRYHWSLAIICNPKSAVISTMKDYPPCIILLDSLGNYHRKHKIVEYLKNFLFHEWQNKSNSRIEYKQDEIQVLAPMVPKQANGYDCGVYILEYAERFLESYERITQSDIDSNLSRFFQSNMFTGEDIDKKRTKIRQNIDESIKKYNEIMKETVHNKSPDSTSIMEIKTQRSTI